MNHGQSKATLIKEALFATCLAWELKQLATSPRPYFGFDLNCGSGENRRNGANVIGTPLILKRHIEKHKSGGYIFLCDKSRRAVEAAKKHFISAQLELFRKSNVRASFIRSDNRKFVLSIPQRIREAGENPRTSHGIIIADPNGIDVPFMEIAACLLECPHLAVLIHLAHAKQIWTYWRNRPDAKSFAPKPETPRNIRQILNTISRTWLLTAPWRVNRGDDHIVLFGSHRVWVPEIRNLRGRRDMISLRSEEGRRIVASLPAERNGIDQGALLEGLELL
jgi:hypothetical protein